jgi:periplasmic protein TonB
VQGGAVTEVQPSLAVGQVTESMDVKAQRTVPPPPPVPDPAAPLEVGGNVQATKIVHLERPVYPPDCKAESVQGTVLLRATIGTDGSILKLERVNQLVDARLVEAAMSAVKQWRYQPTLLNGVPVEVMTDIQLNFALQ